MSYDLIDNDNHWAWDVVGVLNKPFTMAHAVHTVQIKSIKSIPRLIGRRFIVA